MWHKMRRVFRYWTVMRQGRTPLCSGHLNNSKIGYSSMPHLGYVYLSCYLHQSRNRLRESSTQHCSVGVAKVSKKVAELAPKKIAKRLSLFAPSRLILLLMFNQTVFSSFPLDRRG